MQKHIKGILTLVSAVVLLAFLIFIINQTIAIYNNLSSVNGMLGDVVLVILIIIFTGLIITPFLIYFKLPRSLRLPKNDKEKKVYYQQLLKRLAKNQHLKNKNLEFNEENDAQKAFEILGQKADQSIEKTATSVFLTTAISQNGKLDALMVLITQGKMIWEIAHIYWQRPAIKDMINLYANVGATAFLASEVEELDISRQVEPVLSAMLKSPGRSIPVIGHAAHIITDSLLEGSVNAFLTLRVGIIAKKYCGSLDFDKKKARQNAFIEASGLLKNIVIKSSGNVINSLLKATRRTGVNTVKSGVNAVGKAAKNIKNSIGNIAGRAKDFKETSELED